MLIVLGPERQFENKQKSSLWVNVSAARSRTSTCHSAFATSRSTVELFWSTLQYLRGKCFDHFPPPPMLLNLVDYFSPPWFWPGAERAFEPLEGQIHQRFAQGVNSKKLDCFKPMHNSTGNPKTQNNSNFLSYFLVELFRVWMHNTNSTRRTRLDSKLVYPN